MRAIWFCCNKMFLQKWISALGTISFILFPLPKKKRGGKKREMILFSPSRMKGKWKRKRKNTRFQGHGKEKDPVHPEMNKV